MMRLIDSHCHLDFPEFDQDRAQVLQQAAAAGVRALVVPGVRAATWDCLLRLCAGESGLLAALGLHPYFIEEHRASHIDRLHDLIEANAASVVAVGEIGVDARKPELERQWALFRAQLDVAQTLDKPVIVHSVKTHDEVYAELKGRDLARRGVIHAFSGSTQQARHFVEIGYKLGVGGVITYERSHKTREAIRQMPVDALVLESDAPDMPMANHRGERNSPQWLPDVLMALAKLRGDSPDWLAEQLWRNACELFRRDFSGIPKNSYSLSQEVSL